MTGRMFRDQRVMLRLALNINPPGTGREGSFSIRGKKAAFQETEF
jgi:hypothetical protein